MWRYLENDAAQVICIDKTRGRMFENHELGDA